MDSRIIEITSAAYKHGNLNIRSCGIDFFPADVFGASSRAGGVGIPITLKAEGLTKPIKTDIPSDKATGKPRWLFRERSWVKTFVRANDLLSGDTIAIRHIRNRTYQLIPKKRKLRFIDLFAGIGGTRLAFEKAGANCVFSSEWDKFAQGMLFCT